MDEFSFLSPVTELERGERAWASSPELRAHFGQDLDRFLSQRLAGLQQSQQLRDFVLPSANSKDAAR